MAVDPQARGGKLQRSEDQIDDLVGCVGGRRRFRHLDRMTSVGSRCASEGVSERFRPEQCRGLVADADGRTALCVEHRVAADRQPVHDLPDIAFDVGKLVRPEHPGEDVEAAAPVCLEDVGLEPAVGRPSHGAAVAEVPRPFGAGEQVLRHRIALRPGEGLAGFVRQGHDRSSLP